MAREASKSHSLNNLSNWISPFRKRKANDDRWSPFGAASRLSKRFKSQREKTSSTSLASLSSEANGSLKLSILRNSSRLLVNVIEGDYDSSTHDLNTYVEVTLDSREGVIMRKATQNHKKNNKPSYKEIFWFSICDLHHGNRIIISAFERVHKSSLLIGCMSFGVRNILKDGNEANGWFYLLESEVGHSRHLAAPDMTSALQDRNRRQSENSILPRLRIINVILGRDHRGKFGFKLQNTLPVSVIKVVPDGPAHSVGVRDGDTFIELDGFNVAGASSDLISSILRQSTSHVSALLQRTGETTTATATPTRAVTIAGRHPKKKNRTPMRHTASLHYRRSDGGRRYVSSPGLSSPMQRVSLSNSRRRMGSPLLQHRLQKELAYRVAVRNTRRSQEEEEDDTGQENVPGNIPADEEGEGCQGASTAEVVQRFSTAGDMGEVGRVSSQDVDGCLRTSISASSSSVGLEDSLNSECSSTGAGSSLYGGIWLGGDPPKAQVAMTQSLPIIRTAMVHEGREDKNDDMTLSGQPQATGDIKEQPDWMAGVEVAGCGEIASDPRDSEECEYLTEEISAKGGSTTNQITGMGEDSTGRTGDQDEYAASLDHVGDGGGNGRQGESTNEGSSAKSVSDLQTAPGIGPEHLSYPEHLQDADKGGEGEIPDGLGMSSGGSLQSVLPGLQSDKTSRAPPCNQRHSAFVERGRTDSSSDECRRHTYGGGSERDAAASRGHDVTAESLSDGPRTDHGGNQDLVRQECGDCESTEGGECPSSSGSLESSIADTGALHHQRRNTWDEQRREPDEVIRRGTYAGTSRASSSCTSETTEVQENIFGSLEPSQCQKKSLLEAAVSGSTNRGLVNPLKMSKFGDGDAESTYSSRRSTWVGPGCSGDRESQVNSGRRSTYGGRPKSAFLGPKPRAVLPLKHGSHIMEDGERNTVGYHSENGDSCISQDEDGHRIPGLDSTEPETVHRELKNQAMDEENYLKESHTTESEDMSETFSDHKTSLLEAVGSGSTDQRLVNSLKMYKFGDGDSESTYSSRRSTWVGPGCSGDRESQVNSDRRSTYGGRPKPAFLGPKPAFLGPKPKGVLPLKHGSHIMADGKRDTIGYHSDNGGSGIPRDEDGHQNPGLDCSEPETVHQGLKNQAMDEENYLKESLTTESEDMSETFSDHKSEEVGSRGSSSIGAISGVVVPHSDNDVMVAPCADATDVQAPGSPCSDDELVQDMSYVEHDDDSHKGLSKGSELCRAVELKSGSGESYSNEVSGEDSTFPSSAICGVSVLISEATSNVHDVDALCSGDSSELPGCGTNEGLPTGAGGISGTDPRWEHKEVRFHKDGPMSVIIDEDVSEGTLHLSDLIVGKVGEPSLCETAGSGNIIMKDEGMLSHNQGGEEEEGSGRTLLASQPDREPEEVAIDRDTRMAPNVNWKARGSSGAMMNWEDDSDGISQIRDLVGGDRRNCAADESSYPVGDSKESHTAAIDQVNIVGQNRAGKGQTLLLGEELGTISGCRRTSSMEGGMMQGPCIVETPDRRPQDNQDSGSIIEDDEIDEQKIECGGIENLENSEVLTSEKIDAVDERERMSADLQLSNDVPCEEMSGECLGVTGHRHDNERTRKFTRRSGGIQANRIVKPSFKSKLQVYLDAVDASSPTSEERGRPAPDVKGHERDPEQVRGYPITDAQGTPVRQMPLRGNRQGTPLNTNSNASPGGSSASHPLVEDVPQLTDRRFISFHARVQPFSMSDSRYIHVDRLLIQRRAKKYQKLVLLLLTDMIVFGKRQRDGQFEVLYNPVMISDILSLETSCRKVSEFHIKMACPDHLLSLGQGTIVCLASSKQCKHVWIRHLQRQMMISKYRGTKVFSVEGISGEMESVKERSLSVEEEEKSSKNDENSVSRTKYSACVMESNNNSNSESNHYSRLLSEISGDEDDNIPKCNGPTNENSALSLQRLDKWPSSTRHSACLDSPPGDDGDSSSNGEGPSDLRRCYSNTDNYTSSSSPYPHHHNRHRHRHTNSLHMVQSTQSTPKVSHRESFKRAKSAPSISPNSPMSCIVVKHPEKKLVRRQSSPPGSLKENNSSIGSKFRKTIFRRFTGSGTTTRDDCNMQPVTLREKKDVKKTKRGFHSFSSSPQLNIRLSDTNSCSLQGIHTEERIASDVETRSLQDQPIRKSKNSIAKEIKAKVQSLRRRHTEGSLQDTEDNVNPTATKTGPDLDDIRRWADGFESLLKDEFGLEAFRKFLQTEFSDENIEFWLACEEYKNLKPSKMVPRAHKIYEDYVTIQAPREVNLDSRTRLQVVSNLSHPNRHSFEQAQKRIEALMEKDSYPRFLRSDIYLKMQKAAKKNK